jgi:tetratricopeptide (TPR) repeat protein
MRRQALFLTFLFLCLSAWAIDFNPGGYGSISDLYGIDDNAGLTSFPVLNVPMGGLAEGMASAYTAVADDLSFIEWNPAGSSMLNYTELGFFHNNWIADTRVEGIVFASRYKDLGFAAGGKWLYTPFSEYNMYGDRVSKGYYSEAVATLNVSYNFLAGYYFSGISLGVNLKGAFRFVPDYSDANDQSDSEGKLISGSGFSQSAAMAMADVGVLTRFNLLKFYTARERNTSVALVARNLGPPVGGDPLPTSITAALAYKPIRPLVFDFDFTLPMNMEDFKLSERFYWALGMNINITDFVSMRTGFLAKSGNYRVTMGSALNLGKITLDVNYTLDLLTQLTPLNRISLGVRFNFGDQGRKAAAEQVDILYLAGLDAYALGNYDEAKQHWDEALELNPKYDPAKEGINLINNTEAINDRMRDLQTLEF